MYCYLPVLAVSLLDTALYDRSCYLSLSLSGVCAQVSGRPELAGGVQTESVSDGKSAENSPYNFINEALDFVGVHQERILQVCFYVYVEYIYMQKI